MMYSPVLHWETVGGAAGAGAAGDAGAPAGDAATNPRRADRRTILTYI